MLGPQWYMLCVSFGVCCLVVDAPVVQVVFLPVVVHDRCPWFRLFGQSWRCRSRSSFTVVDVAVITQRHVCLATGRCHRFSSSPESVDISVATETGPLSLECGGDERFVGLFYAIFRALSIRTLSAR